MACNCGAATGGGTILRATAPLAVDGAGTATSPYRLSLTATGAASVLQVRDTTTVDFSLLGSGTAQDPWILSASTAAATKLSTLGDVAASPAPSAGRVPMWIGATNSGQFELRTPGVRYTTSTTRGAGLYQGEVARDTDTQKRYEWDGTQWLSLDVSAASLDATVVQNAGTVTSTTDWNTLKDRSGIYQVSAGITSTNNGPQGATPNGTLEVLKSGTSVTQNYSTQGTPTAVYTRTTFDGASTWSPWIRLVNADEVYTRTAADARYPVQGAVATTDGNGNSTASGAGVIAWKVGRVVTLNFALRIQNSGGFPSGGATLLTVAVGAAISGVDFKARTSTNTEVWLSMQTDGAVVYRQGGSGAAVGDFLYGTVSFVTTS